MVSSLSAGHVSKEHRAIADAMDREQRKYQRIGINAALKLTWTATQATINAYKLGSKNLGKVLRKSLWKGVPLLAESMTISWLLAYDRVHGKKRKIDLSLSDYSNAVYFLQHRLELTKKQMGQINSKFNASALWMYKQASWKTEKQLQEAMLDITKNNLPMRQGVMRLHKAFDKAGIMPGRSYALESIYRTQTALAYSAGKRWAAKNPTIDEILWGYKYVTVGDDRVRPSHELLDGVTLPKDDEFWSRCFTPNGWCCRCQCIELYSKHEIVEAPEEPVEVDGKEVEAGPDEGFDFDPGELFGDVSDPDDMSDEQDGAWVEKAAEKQVYVAPTEEDIEEYIATLSKDEREILADQLGLDIDDLEQGWLDLSLCRAFPTLNFENFNTSLILDTVN